MCKGYFGSYTNNKSEGIYSFDFQKGKFENVNLAAKIENCTYIHKRGKDVFSIIRGKDCGGISYFIESEDGLKHINTVMNHKNPCCYITSNEKYIFAANYHQGKCHIYTVENGELKEVYTIHEESNAKCHCININNNNGYIYICFLGLDKIKIYDLNNNFKYIDEIVCPNGSGPRHGVFTKDYSKLYILSELSNEVFLYNNIDGKYQLEQSISTLPTEFTEESYAAAIRVTNDERFIYTSNRGHDSIAAFEIAEGRMKLIDYYNTKGNNPRDFNLDPNDQYILIVNQHTSNGVCFSRNVQNGELEEIVDEIKIEDSVCISF